MLPKSPHTFFFSTVKEKPFFPESLNNKNIRDIFTIWNKIWCLMPVGHEPGCKAFPACWTSHHLSNCYGLKLKCPSRVWRLQGHSVVLVSEALQSLRGEARMMEVRQNREGTLKLCLPPVPVSGSSYSACSQYGCPMQTSAKICATAEFMDHSFPSFVKPWTKTKPASLSLRFVVTAMRKVTKY